MARAWSILMAAHFMLTLAEPACPEGGVCLVPQDDSIDEVSMLQDQRHLLVQAASDASEADVEVSSDILVESDVAYGSKDKQKVDIYWPAAAELKPSAGWTAVIILPGDGSNRKGWKGFCKNYIVPSGRLCVAADYRQSDAYRDDDVFNLAKWFHEKATDWDVDTTKIVLGGASLGGLTINNVIWDKSKGKTLLNSPPKVRAVMLLSGTWDGHQRQAKKAKYHPETTFIMSSNDDKTVPYKYSNNLHKELGKLGEDTRLVKIIGGGHAIWHSDKKDEWYAEILAFLDDILPVDDTYR